MADSLGMRHRMGEVKGEDPAQGGKRLRKWELGRLPKTGTPPLLLLRLGLGVQLGPSAITRTGRQKEVSSLWVTGQQHCKVLFMGCKNGFHVHYLTSSLEQL